MIRARTVQLMAMPSAVSFSLKLMNTLNNNELPQAADQLTQEDADY